MCSCCIRLCLGFRGLRPGRVRLGSRCGALGSGLVRLRPFLLPGCVVGLGLGLCLRIGRSLTFVLKALHFYLFNCDGASIFRGLYYFTSLPDHRLAIGVLVDGIRIDLVHQSRGVLIAVAGVGLGPLGLRDAQGIARFKEFQRQWVFRTTGSNL